MEFTQGGDIGAEKHIVAHVRVLVGVQETHTVANSESVEVTGATTVEVAIFASIATHYTLIDKRK